MDGNKFIKYAELGSVVFHDGVAPPSDPAPDPKQLACTHRHSLPLFEQRPWQLKEHLQQAVS